MVNFTRFGLRMFFFCRISSNHHGTIIRCDPYLCRRGREGCLRRVTTLSLAHRRLHRNWVKRNICYAGFEWFRKPKVGQWRENPASPKSVPRHSVYQPVIKAEMGTELIHGDDDVSTQVNRFSLRGFCEMRYSRLAKPSLIRLRTRRGFVKGCAKTTWLEPTWIYFTEETLGSFEIETVESFHSFDLYLNQAKQCE